MEMKCVVFLAVLSLAYGAGWRSSDGDAYIDTIANVQLPREVRNAYLDPAQLSNFNDVIQTPTHGRVPSNFSHGQLIGLSKVFRSGYCTGPKYVARNISLNCTLGFRDLKAVYVGQSRVPGFTRFNAVGNITNAYAIAKITSSPNYNRPALKSLEVYGLNFGPGRTAFDRSVVEALNRKALAQLRSFVNVHFKAALHRSVQQVPMPLPRAK